MMAVNYQLRPVMVQDAEQLQQACWPNWSTEAVKELLWRAEDIARRERGIGLVAYAEAGILGYGQLTMWPRAAEISDLLIAATYRNKGIGTAIICALVDNARSWGLPEVEIGSALSNPRALALYRRLGFKDNRILNLDLGNGPEPVMYLTMQLIERFDGQSSDL